MTTQTEGNRHVPLAVIEGYLAERTEGVVGVDGSPMGRLLISPNRHALAIQLSAGDRAPNVVEFENLDFDVISDDNGVWHQLAVRLDDNLEEVYALLCAILDRVQLSGESFADAVEETLKSLTGILAVRNSLTRERQVGLYGELCVLLALADEIGGEAAIDAWRGPRSEEHDFGLASEDVEVKTTLGERREHWISTATQLVPTGGRPLYLLSIQLTTAPVDAGNSLPGLVSSARSKMASQLSRLEATLGRAGYRDRDSDLYHSRWTLRTTPAFYEVGPQFPAITQLILDSVVPSAERITDLRYRIDLTGLTPLPALFPFGRL